MNTAEKKYQHLILTGEWKTEDAKDELVTALQAQIQELKAARDNGSPRKPRIPNSQKSPEQQFTGKWAWRAVAPKQGEPTSKVYEGKTYYWCPKHGFWTNHKPEECRLNKPAEEKKPENKPEADKQQLTFVNALLSAEEPKK